MRLNIDRVADVYIDGANQGSVPAGVAFVQERMATGPHRIEIRKEGYATIKEEVLIAENRQTSKSYVMMSMAATAVLAARPTVGLTLTSPDGSPRFGALDGEKGYWRAAQFKSDGRVPLQARPPSGVTNGNLAESCVILAGPLQMQSSGGFEILERPDIKQVWIRSSDGPDAWRIIYMDGRSHPPPSAGGSAGGHSIGKYEGDVLLVDSAAFDLWSKVAKEVPIHSEGLHLVEKFSRDGSGGMTVTVIVDDPGAYNNAWQFTLRSQWIANQDMPKSFCR